MHAPFIMAMFRDRRDAGIQLAAALQAYAGDSDVVVLALPRGGLPVAYEVATRLRAPLDVLLVRKLGVPQQPELAMGAIASGDIEVIEERVIRELRIPPGTFGAVAARERVELLRRERLFRGDRPLTDLRDKTAIVVDDGLATGSTMKAAIDSVRGRGVACVVAAVPVGPPATCRSVAAHADRLVCLLVSEAMHAVGLAYDDFSQIEDDEVRQLLDLAVRDLRARSDETARADDAHVT
jgi:predicted phosphoribosyltransferase